MFCNKCGQEIPDDAKFCVVCGAPVVQASVPAEEQYQPPVPVATPVVESVEEPLPAVEPVAEPVPAVEPVAEPAPAVEPVAEPAPDTEMEIVEDPDTAAEIVAEIDLAIAAETAQAPVTAQTIVFDPVPVAEASPVEETTVLFAAEPAAEPVAQHPAEQQFQQFLQYQQPAEEQYQQPVQEQYQQPVQEQPQQPVQEQYQQPVQQYVPEYPVTPVQPDTKQEAKRKPKKKKPMGRLKYAYVQGGAVSWISFVFLIISTILVGVCMFITLNSSFLELPLFDVVSIVDADAKENVEKFVDGAEGYYKTGRDKLGEWKETLPAEQQEKAEVAEELLDSIWAFAENPNYTELKNLVSMVNENKELVDELEEYGIKGADETTQKILDESKNIEMWVDILYWIVMGCFILCMFLTFMAAMFRNTVMTVFGMICSALICVSLANVVLAAIIVVLDITCIVLNMIVSGKHRRYIRNFAMA